MPDSYGNNLLVLLMTGRANVCFQAVLEGIRRGDIVGSGVVHSSISKEGLLNKGPREDYGRGHGRGQRIGIFHTSLYDHSYLHLCASIGCQEVHLCVHTCIFCTCLSVSFCLSLV